MLERLGNRVQDFLELLRELGVERTRFYEYIACSDHDGQPELVLAEALPPTAHAVQPGYRIPFHESVLASGDLASRKIVTCFGVMGDSRNHVNQLSLVGRTWFAVGVVERGRPVGVLAGDWTGPREHCLTDSDRVLLLAISLALGDSVEPPPLEPTAATAALAHHMAPRSTFPYLDLPAVLDYFSASAIAIFRHDWKSGHLVKIAQEFAHDYQRRARLESGFPEEYAITERYYTPMAWRAGGVYPVHNFADFSDKGDAYGPSKAWHEAVLEGPVTSMLYGTVASGTTPYLIRLINRRDNRYLSFQRQLQGFAGFVDRISARVDRDVFADCLKVTSNFATSLKLTPFDLASLEQPFVVALEAIGVQSFLLTRQQGSEVEELFPGEHSSDLRTRYLNSDISMSRDNPSATLDCRQCLTVRNSRHGQLAVLNTSAKVGEHIIDLAIPLEWRVGTIDAATFDSLFGNLRLHEPLLLEALCAIMGVTAGFVAGAKYIARGQEFGLTLAQYLSHEVGSRATDVCALATRSLRAILERPDETSSYWAADAAITTISTLREDLSRTIDNAALLDRAQILVFMEPHKISVIAQQAAATCRARFSVDYRQRYDIPDFAIKVQASEGTYVCDLPRVVQAITALLDNAVKYSQKRGTHPSEIRLVTTLTPTQLVVRVDNWGLALPEGRDGTSEVLTKPFIRGDIRSSQRRVPGLGIGLHIAYTNIRAHGGTLRIYSRATRSEPDLRHRDGHNVTVEAILPATHQPGNYSWSEEGGLVREAVPQRFNRRGGRQTIA